MRGSVTFPLSVQNGNIQGNVSGMTLSGFGGPAALFRWGRTLIVVISLRLWNSPLITSSSEDFSPPLVLYDEDCRAFVQESIVFDRAVKHANAFLFETNGQRCASREMFEFVPRLVLQILEYFVARIISPKRDVQLTRSFGTAVQCRRRTGQGRNFS